MSDLKEEMLDVGDGHRLHVESFGEGAPVVFLHGGPGGGCHPDQRTLFDPTRQRAVMFDQRGAGRSTPARSLAANTTAHLVADLERIRLHFGIERWIVVGGSWGTTLALAYAEQHPEHVAGLVLRAVFLGTIAELEWAFLNGPDRIRPELLGDFLSVLTAEEQRSPLASYWKRILDPDPAVHSPAIWAWYDIERILSSFDPPNTRLDMNRSRPARLPSTPLFEAHYFSHHCFLEPDQLLNGAAALRGIPGIIIQGRYDLLCPPGTSASLAAVWPESEVRMVERAGHSVGEPGVRDAVTTAIGEIASSARF